MKLVILQQQFLPRLFLKAYHGRTSCFILYKVVCNTQNKQWILIAFRTRIIHYFSMEHGPFWFMDASKFKNQSIFNSCLDNIAAEVNRSREDFISEYYNNYTAPSFPPAWKTLEVFPNAF